MKIFEYRFIDHDMFDFDEMTTMNSMGSKGWRVIRIMEPMKYTNSESMFIRVYYEKIIEKKGSPSH